MAIHWLSLVLVAGLAGAGFFMVGLPDDSGTRLLLSRLHAVGGVTLMLLVGARLFLRARRPAPAPLPLAPLHRRGIAVIHGLIYAVLGGIGATGALTGIRGAWGNYLRGAVSNAPALDALLSREVHEALVLSLVGLLALHVGGVVLQQVRRGDVLQRMIPSSK
ncbi:MAG: cytochrome b/b6 domain-containing protein [Myxococcales bacterium]|nr:cytochrome b/b6 domain-containing protein [Myxococcales bacterium]